MSYREQLYPWCIVRRLPKMQNAIVARCRRRNEAEEHLRVLQRLVRDGEFAVVFDLPIESHPAPASEKQGSHAGHAACDRVSIDGANDE